MVQGKKKSIRISHIKHENDIITDDLKKAESFNNFFTSIGSKLESDLIPVDGFNNLEDFHKITPTIRTISVDTEKIKKGIKRVAKPEKGFGADTITSTELNVGENFAPEGLQHVIE